jgi:hypothetical protein
VSRNNNSFAVTKTIFDSAIHKRSRGDSGRFILLSTCDGESKDRRDVLLVRIMDDDS